MKRKKLYWILTLTMALSLFMAIIPVTANADIAVCEIVGGTTYATLDEAFESAVSGDTIKLLTNIDYTNSLLIENKSITFALNGYILNLSSTVSWGHGLEVGEGGTVDIDDTLGGELNLFGNNSNTDYGTGLYIHDGGSATVTNITSYGWANGTDCTGGTLTVKEDVHSGGNGVFGQCGAHVIVEGNIYSGGMGAIASWEETLIEIRGDVNTTNGLGLSVSAGTIIVEGNVNSTNFGGVSVSFDGNAEVRGNVTAGSFGAKVNNVGVISIDGVITASEYILLDDVLTSADDFTVNGDGYYLYTDSENSVRVKIHACLIDGCSTSLEDGGFTEYTEIDGELYYHVTNARQLAHINEHLNLNYLQTADIDLSEEYGGGWSPIGSDYGPTLSFTGVYDGGGHSVTGLYVNHNATATNKYPGLFGVIYGDAAVYNLNVSGDISYHCRWYCTNAAAGGIAAYLIAESGQQAVIDNCTFTGNITTTGEVSINNNNMQSTAGGVVGYARNAIIRNCGYNGGNAQASCINSPGSTTYAYAGGIAGIMNSHVDLINCYSAGEGLVSAGSSSINYAGGIVGRVDDNNTITLCYNSHSVAVTPEEGGTGEKGGIAGHLEPGNTVSSAYWLDTCGADYQAGNSPALTGSMTEASMQDPYFKDTLNSVLNTLTDTGLYLWEQNEGAYPALSGTLWDNSLIPRVSGGGSSYSPTVYYSISSTCNEGGAISPSGTTNVEKGGSETFIVTPAWDYIISDVLIDGESIGAVTKYTFSSIGSNHTIEAVFAYASAKEQFTDVSPDSWYYEAVNYVLLSGLFEGTTETTFEPKANMTRAMLVTVLWRLDGEPASASANPFSDVSQEAWYSNAVIWAAENDIVKGYAAEIFSPNDSITREQMAAILFRYAEYKGYDPTASGSLAAFNDAGNVSEWALPAFSWTLAEKLINGISETKLDPHGNASRAQVAMIIMRFVSNIAK